MATLIRGILSRSLDWNSVLAGAFLALVCGVVRGEERLAFAIGVYLPLSTTLPTRAGGAIKGIVHRVKKSEAMWQRRERKTWKKCNLFATGLVAGGSLMGVYLLFSTYRRR